MTIPHEHGLRAHVVVRREGFTLDAELTADPGQVISLLGPNGAGKTTMLSALAGLIRLDGGRISLAGNIVADHARHVPPQQRHVGVVWQDYLLFPHLSVMENVAFGLRARGVPRRQARAEAEKWLARVGIGDVAGRKPRRLSGGQAQRVALARALIVKPKLLLLDEPLAALDAGVRPTIRADLRRHLSVYEGCTVVVTHDPLEALVLGDRVVVFEDGRVVQDGAPADLTRHPRTDYVAALVGLNLLRGVASGVEVTVDQGAELVLAHPAEGEVYVAFSPAAVTLSRSRPEGSARNVWRGTVADVETHGDLVRVNVAGEVDVLADVTPLAVADLGLEPGADVWASVKASEITAYSR